MKLISTKGEDCESGSLSCDSLAGNPGQSHRVDLRKEHRRSVRFVTSSSAPLPFSLHGPKKRSRLPVALALRLLARHPVSTRACDVLKFRSAPSRRVQAPNQLMASTLLPCSRPRDANLCEQAAVQNVWRSAPSTSASSPLRTVLKRSAFECGGCVRWLASISFCHKSEEKERKILFPAFSVGLSAGAQNRPLSPSSNSPFSP